MNSPPHLPPSCKSAFLIIIMTICFGLWPLHSPSAEETAQQIQDQIERLQKVADGLKDLHEQLQINRDEVFRLHERANDNLQGNILKVYIKGGMEIYNKVTAPLNGALELLTEVYLNLQLEPKIWTIAEDRVILLGLSKQAARENARLALLYTALSDVMQQDAERFDDDLPPLRYTQNWWGTPDGKPDPEIERVTRKLRIVRELSNKVYLRTDAEMVRVREERRQVLSLIAKRSPELAQRKAQETKRADEMARWQQSQQQRQAHRTGAMTGDGRGPGIGEDFASDRPPQDLSGETPAQRTARLKKEQAEQVRLEQERLALERHATVYVDSDCPRTYVAGDTGTFLARISPDDVSGYFVWRLDDKVIGRGPVLRYTFTTVGQYDLSVDLTTKWGRFEDRYLDQVRVDPAPVKPLPPAYPPEMEGRQTVALDLPYCKYWTRFQDGKITITGYYFTFSGQKISYTSQSITNYSPAFPAAGMFVLADGTGYHVYQTEKGSDESPSGVVYNIARMKGAEVKIMHRLPVNGLFRMVPSPDNRFWTVTYTGLPGGPQIKLVLN